MRLGVVADIHGNAAALNAVLESPKASEIDDWWALGDLVLFGPRPVEVLETLASLPRVSYVSGNTDRYVVTGQQPRPHATPADAAGDVDLVERYGAMAGAIGWTRGALAQAGQLSFLVDLPIEQRIQLPDGRTLLGVHASPGRDDGAGIDNHSEDEGLRRLFADCGADVVVGGHTHDPTDRTLGALRALNAGSVGIPLRCGYASWMSIEADSQGLCVHRQEAAFDVDGVVEDLYARGYPNAAFMETVLTGTRSLVV
jgi:predicted phosphodiesterase